jgi:hypothetical protein
MISESLRACKITLWFLEVVTTAKPVRLAAGLASFIKLAKPATYDKPSPKKLEQVGTS